MIDGEIESYDKKWVDDIATVFEEENSQRSLLSKAIHENFRKAKILLQKKRAGTLTDEDYIAIEEIRVRHIEMGINNEDGTLTKEYGGEYTSW